MFNVRRGGGLQVVTGKSKENINMKMESSYMEGEEKQGGVRGVAEKASMSLEKLSTPQLWCR